MARFLLDANVSCETCDFLRDVLNLDAVHISSLGYWHLDDRDIVAFAQRENRVIITFDLDFGRMFRHRGQGPFGAIVLRLGVQTIESTNGRLRDFFLEFTDLDVLDQSLVILEDQRFRVISSPV
jgi:predicted nuclease of predicted toxin-antitoxin system